MAIEVYSCDKDGETRLSDHFRVKELACRDGSDPVFVDRALVDVLEAVRGHFGRAVTVTSGYRTPPYNASAAVGGAAHSQHLYGRAADIRVAGVPVEQVAAYAETLLPDRGGIGRYPPKAGRPVGWVHIDVRSGRSRWTL